MVGCGLENKEKKSQKNRARLDMTWPDRHTCERSCVACFFFEGQESLINSCGSNGNGGYETRLPGAVIRL